MSAEKLPQFIKDGTFSWGALDYHYREGPQAGLDAPEALASADPWVMLAATLERAKRGDHEPIGRLERLVRSDNQNALVTNMALELVGTAGTRDQLRLLEAIMLHGEDSLAAEACGAASCAGTLSLVSSMLAAWTRTNNFRHRQTISLRLGLLLEEWDGPITTMEPAYESENAEETEEEDPEKEIFATESQYEEIIKAAVAEVRSRCSSDDSPVILGKPFGVVSLAEYMLDLVKSDIDQPTLGSMFLYLRHRFDASTGIDCSRFFDQRKFQPLAAAAILEEFLESSETEKYVEGVRYFFGHRIPD
jgi:hypothetical protein